MNEVLQRGISGWVVFKAENFTVDAWKISTAGWPAFWRAIVKSMAEKSYEQRQEVLDKLISSPPESTAEGEEALQFTIDFIALSDQAFERLTEAMNLNEKEGVYDEIDKRE